MIVNYEVGVILIDLDPLSWVLSLTSVLSVLISAFLYIGGSFDCNHSIFYVVGFMYYDIGDESSKWNLIFIGSWLLCSERQY